jgi:signal transduction histidine kinase
METPMDPIERHSGADDADGKPELALWPALRVSLLTLVTCLQNLAARIRAGIEQQPQLRRLRGRWRAWTGQRKRRGPRVRARGSLARNPLHSRWARAAGIAAIMLVILFNGFVAFRSVQVVRDHAHWVSQSNIVLAQLATLTTDLDDAENAVHSYVITGDTSYLQPYSGAPARLNSELAQLTGLMADNHAQQQRALALKPLIAADLADLQTTMTLRQASQTVEAMAQVASGQGKRAMDHTRALLGQMQATENALLHSRDVSASGALRATAITLALAGLIDLWLLGTVLVLVRKSLLLREQVAIERARAETQAQLLTLEETNRRMSDFMSMASHELRNPLTSAKANVQQMERLLHRTADAQSEVEESQVTRLRELAARAERQMNRQDRLVSDLLDLSRIQAGKLSMRPEFCDLAAIARDTVQEQRTLNGGRHIELTVAPDGELRIRADADRIGQVLTNYLTNALKYSPRESPVEVVVERRGKNAYAAVRDRGPGLPPDEQHRIWERFHRAQGVEVLSGTGIGLGLGLYISRTIIRRHGGKVGVESTPGSGSTFWLTLPLVGERAVLARKDPQEGSGEAAR